MNTYKIMLFAQGDGDHAFCFLGAENVQAECTKDAEQYMLDHYWDDRLTCASCLPVFEYDPMDDPEDADFVGEPLDDEV